MAYFIKIANAMLGDIPYVEGMVKMTAKPIPGHKDFNHVMQIGEDGADFIKDLKSISLRFDRYKAPRIAFRKRA